MQKSSLIGACAFLYTRLVLLMVSCKYNLLTAVPFVSLKSMPTLIGSTLLPLMKVRIAQMVTGDPS